MAISEGDGFLAIEGRLRRWAQELHDETLQGIGAVRMRLAAARRGSSGERDSAIDEAIDQLSDQISALRGLISELRPATLDEYGLAAAIEGLAEHHEITSGLEIEVEIDLADARGVETELEPELEDLVFRATQEALANVARHARAERVELKLRRAVGGVELTVADDGVGFDPGAPTDGLGLIGLGERVSMHRGHLAVRALPDEGTTVRVRVPLAPAGADEPAQPASASSSPRSSA
jgi:signal transduction histidine kinase